MDLQPKRPGGLLHFCALRLDPRVDRVQEETDIPGGGHQIVQQPQPFRHQLRTQLGHTGDVATWSIQARHKTKLDRIAGRLEHDRDGRGHSLGGKRRRRPARQHHTDAPAHQVGCQCRKLVDMTISPTKFDRDVLALDAAGFTQALPKGGLHERSDRAETNESDYR